MKTYIGGIEKAKQRRGGECKFIVAIAIELLVPKGVVLAREGRYRVGSVTTAFSSRR